MVLFIINTIQQSFFLVLYSYRLGAIVKKIDEKQLLHPAVSGNKEEDPTCALHF